MTWLRAVGSSDPRAAALRVLQSAEAAETAGHPSKVVALAMSPRTGLLTPRTMPCWTSSSRSSVRSTRSERPEPPRRACVPRFATTREWERPGGRRRCGACRGLAPAFLALRPRADRVAWVFLTAEALAASSPTTSRWGGGTYAGSSPTGRKESERCLARDRLRHRDPASAGRTRSTPEAVELAELLGIVEQQRPLRGS